MIKHVSPGFIILARTVSSYAHNVPDVIPNVSGSWSKLLCINLLCIPLLWYQGSRYPREIDILGGRYTGGRYTLPSSYWYLVVTTSGWYTSYSNAFLFKLQFQGRCHSIYAQILPVVGAQWPCFENGVTSSLLFEKPYTQMSRKKQIHVFEWEVSL